jgi:hypothetical protein
VCARKLSGLTALHSIRYGDKANAYLSLLRSKTQILVAIDQDNGSEYSIRKFRSPLPLYAPGVFRVQRRVILCHKHAFIHKVSPFNSKHHVALLSFRGTRLAPSCSESTLSGLSCSGCAGHSQSLSRIFQKPVPARPDIFQLPGIWHAGGSMLHCWLYT